MFTMTKQSLRIIGFFVLILAPGCKAPITPLSPPEFDSLTDQNGNVLILGAPSHLYLFHKTSYSVGIAWENNSQLYTSSILERKTNNGAFAAIVAAPRDMSYYLDVDLEKQNSYDYRVYAVKDSTGKSMYSNILSIRFDSVRNVWAQQ